MNKLLIFVTLMSFVCLANAQVVNGKHKKLAKNFENEKWEDCAYRADKMLAQSKNINDAEIHLYLAYSYSKIYLMCLNDKTLLDKVPAYKNAYKNALKYAVSAKKKDNKIHEIFPANNDLLEDIVIAGTYDIDEFMIEKKYPKAKSLIIRMMKAYEDSNIEFLYGVLCMMTDEYDLGFPLVEKSIAEKSNSKSKQISRTDYMMIDGFDFYYSYLTSQEPPMLEEARTWIDKGLELFKDNEVLLYDKFLLDNTKSGTIKPENQTKKLSLKYINSSVTKEKDNVNKDDDDDDDDDDDE